MSIQKYNSLLQHAFAKAGYAELNDFQSSLSNPFKSGKDLIVSAPKDAGKSLSLVLNVLEKINQASEDNNAPRALIITPDIESSTKLQDLFTKLAYGTDVRIVLAIDRANSVKQRIDLFEGSDIVIGNIKRVFDLYNQNGINFKHLKYFILDDAEKVIGTNLHTPVMRLCESMFKTQKIIYCESETPRLLKLCEEILRNPQHLSS